MRLSRLGLGSIGSLLANTAQYSTGKNHVSTDEMAAHMKKSTSDEGAEALKRVQAKFKNREPLFREAAAFRGLMSAVFTSPAPDWFSELVDNETYKTMCMMRGGSIDLHSTIMAWSGMKMKEVSDTPNWFRPSEGLTYKLTATELVGATCGDLKLPMDAFYIELPEKFLYIEDAKTGWHEARMLTVTLGVITEKTLEIARKLGDLPEGVVTGPRLLVECYAEPNENSKDAFDDSWLFMSYKILEDDKDMGAVLGASLNLSKIETMQNGRIGERIFDGHALRVFLLKFVLNFCVYLGSERATKKHAHVDEIDKLCAGKKRKNLRKNVQERIKRLENDKVFLVGTDIEVDLEMKEIIQTEGTSSYRLTYRTLVRGHWRNQAHGPGWALRRRKWIEPHVRGQELPTKVVGHTYNME